jgi:hypothetical protein
MHCFSRAHSYVVFEIVESRTTDDTIHVETLSSIHPHPSYSSAEKVIFFVVIIYQYFAFLPSFFMCLKNYICIGLWSLSKL